MILGALWWRLRSSPDILVPEFSFVCGVGYCNHCRCLSSDVLSAERKPPKLGKFSSFDKPWRYQICIAKCLYFIETICPKMCSKSPLKSAYITSTKRLKTPPLLAQFPGIHNKVLYGKAPPRAPTPCLSIYHFWQKRYPLSYTSLLYINKSLTKEELFLDFYTATKCIW